MPDYQYTKFTTAAYDLDNFKGPQLGTKIDAFDVTEINGGKVNLLGFEGKFLVLELGSITCPLFQGRRKGMAAMLNDNPDVSFAILYVREAHPGRDIGQHKSLDNKVSNARMLRDDDGEGRRILIDDMTGSVHKAFGGFPNSAFIINRNGCLVYKSDWNNPAATTRALARLKAGKAAGGPGMFLPAPPPLALKILRRAGRDALWDFLKDLPVLIWKNAIKRNLRNLFRRQADVRADHIC